jgi:integrase
MGRHRPPGLTLRGGVWHIDKQIGGTRIRESCETGDLRQAQELLAKRIDDNRQARVFGVRLVRTFREAATKYLIEAQHKRSLATDAIHLKMLMPFIGTLPLTAIHSESLKPFVAARRASRRKTKSINLALGVVRRVLNLAADEWMDERGVTWLAAAPKIRMYPVTDARRAYPMSLEEQRTLMQELPDHLARMALFKVNTGTREQEVCGLKWEYETKVPELGISVFVVPGQRVKNGDDRLIVLNRVARSVIDSLRGKHPEFVFVRETTTGWKPVTKMNNTAWKSARVRAADQLAKKSGRPSADGYRRLRVHDLKHTFGRRLRAAGVSFEDRQDLLGHRSGRITTEYSRAELSNLIAAAEMACGENPHKIPTISWSAPLAPQEGRRNLLN